MTVKHSNKSTEFGSIPEDWKVYALSDLCRKILDGTHFTPKYVAQGIPFYSVENVTSNDFTNTKFISKEEHNFLIKRCRPERGDIMMTRITAGILGDTKIIDWDVNASIYVSLALIKPNGRIIPEYLYRYSKSPSFRRSVELRGLVNATPKKINLGDIGNIPIPVPPTQTEQRAIAEALSDVDDLINSLDKLIAKKRAIKQATMQQLLTGKTRLPGFSGEWVSRTLGEITECLDNRRIPINESDRERMKGEYPYCGANGILGGVNCYIFDEDIILIAEDGGYFDEFSHRPIAYRMSGKCWVNNHAHVLKARPECDQDFIFFSLVHKNILNFLASGTRAKLNKSEMVKIPISTPKCKSEQRAIADVLQSIENETDYTKRQVEKVTTLKQGMMQELLTGRIRLV